MELAEKVIRFGRIAEEADEFQTLVWRRLGLALLPKFFTGDPVWKRLRRHMKLRQDLFDIDTPPEIAALARDEMTAAERASPYAAITTARFSLPALAQFTIQELQLVAGDVEAIESLVELRKTRIEFGSARNFLVFALAALSWLSTEIPDAMFPHWGIDQRTFTIAAFYAGCGLVGLAVYVIAIDLMMNRRAEKQARLAAQLIVHCRAQLQAGAAK